MTSVLPRFDDALFLTERADSRKDGKHWGLSSERCAKIMGAAMKTAGIPEDFLPHSARHAGQAYYKSKWFSDDEVMAIANISARTYVLHYRQRIRRTADALVAPAI